MHVYMYIKTKYFSFIVQKKLFL